MKRFIPYIIVFVLLLSAGMTASCSAAKPASQNTNDCTQPPAVAQSANPLPTQAPPAATPAAAPSNWDTVLNIAIAHPTNILGFLNEKLGITVGYGGEIHYSNDGGQTWPNAVNTSACRFCLDIVNSQLAWCGGNSQNVRVSRDGGKTWTAVTDIDLGGLHSNISFLDDKTGWISTLSRYACTTDGGKTWKELKLPEGATSIAALSLRTPKDGYLLTLDGLLFTTADGGATWSKQDLGFAKLKIADSRKQPKLYNNVLAVADISFTDEKNGSVVFTGIVPGEGCHTWCMTTTDSGATWKTEEIPAPSFTPAKLFLSKDGKYLTLSSSTNQTVLLKRK